MLVLIQIPAAIHSENIGLSEDCNDMESVGDSGCFDYIFVVPFPHKVNVYK